MANILDYLNWRGDLSFKNSKFNEVDNVIFSRFSYLDYDNILDKNEIVSIHELNERYTYESTKEKVVLSPHDPDLLQKMANTKRYQDILVTKYVNKIDVNTEEQFSALTLILPDGTLYVSFRGTDDTIVGWKEDFNLSFKEEIPAQKSALRYLKNILKEYKEEKIRIGGHSKGGNLALYAAMNISDDDKKRVINIFNNDGPGFQKDIILSEKFKSIQNKIYNFIPQTSIVGRLLFHGKKYIVVESGAKGIMQHDVYTWHVLGKEFVHLNSLDEQSTMIQKAIENWMNELDNEHRGEFIETLYKILNETNVKTVQEFTDNWQRNAITMLKSYKNIPEVDRKMIIRTIVLLFGSGKNVIANFLPKIQIKKKKVKKVKDEN